MSARNTLDSLWTKGKELLGSEYAIMAGAMSWVSDRNLVSAISNAGGFGVIAASSMPPEILDTEIKETQKLAKQPFGVNLITMHPQLDELVQTCINNNVTHVVLAGGLPKTATIDQLKQGGIKVLCFAPAIPLVKKLMRSKVDGLIIEGSEAGGHIGPVATNVLAQEILPFVNENYPDTPVFVAGGIGRGEAIVNYLEMGAAGVQLGTRFVCAKESIAHENFKRLFIKSSARDAMPSVQVDPDFPVIPVRAIENKATDAFTRAQIAAIGKVASGELSKEEAQLEIEHFWAGALRKAVIDGDVENGSVMAGQSVGMVKSEQTSKEILDELVDQACAFIDKKAA